MAKKNWQGEFLYEVRQQIQKLRKNKSLFGLVLLILALLYQSNPYPLNNWISGIVYRPQSTLVNSPWPWKNQRTIHPIIVNLPQEAETSIKSVADYIVRNEPNSYKQIKAAHDYVVSRVSYDLGVLTEGIRPSQKPLTVFHKRVGVCEGYARLFQALGKAMGYKTAYITGKVRRDLAPIDVIPQARRLANYGYDWTLHAWNGVKIEGNWYLVDTTWDDGNLYKTDYLLVPPAAMISSHFPSSKNWQLLPSTINHEAFENKPLLTTKFFAQGLELVAPRQYENELNKGKNVANIKVKSPVEYRSRIIAYFGKQAPQTSILDVFPNQAKTRKSLVSCNSEKLSPQETNITCQLPQPGTYQIYLFSQGRTNNRIGQLKFKIL